MPPVNGHPLCSSLYGLYASGVLDRAIQENEELLSDLVSGLVCQETREKMMTVTFKRIRLGDSNHFLHLLGGACFGGPGFQTRQRGRWSQEATLPFPSGQASTGYMD